MTSNHDNRISENQDARVLILGGAGFVGAKFAQLLISRRIAFQVADLRLSGTGAGFHCDVRDRACLMRLITSGDVIVNLAAEHRDDVRPLSRYRETNVDGAVNVCDAARAAGTKKIIFTSSVAVYGFHPDPLDESGPFTPFNEYGKTKLAAEAVYRAWAAENSTRTLIIVRPTVIFGEGNRGNVYNLLHQIASGRFLMVGSGQNVKSMAYVGNVAAFLAHCLSMEPGEHIFNYVDGPDMTTRQLVQHVWRCLGRTDKIRSIPKPLALSAAHLLDFAARLSGRTFPISAIRIRKFCESTRFLAERSRATGFVPPYSLEEGLSKTIEFDFPGKC